jgi:hypothetical protein
VCAYVHTAPVNTNRVVQCIVAATINAFVTLDSVSFISSNTSRIFMEVTKFFFFGVVFAINREEFERKEKLNT